MKICLLCFYVIINTCCHPLHHHCWQISEVTWYINVASAAYILQIIQILCKWCMVLSVKQLTEIVSQIILSRFQMTTIKQVWSVYHKPSSHIYEGCILSFQCLWADDCDIELHSLKILDDLVTSPQKYHRQFTYIMFTFSQELQSLLFSSFLWFSLELRWQNVCWDKPSIHN